MSRSRSYQKSRCLGYECGLDRKPLQSLTEILASLEDGDKIKILAPLEDDDDVLESGECDPTIYVPGVRLAFYLSAREEAEFHSANRRLPKYEADCILSYDSNGPWYAYDRAA